MTIPLAQAAKALKHRDMTWDEYIHNLMFRCFNAEHKKKEEMELYEEFNFHDTSSDDSIFLQSKDPFAYSVRNWSEALGPVEDTAALEAVFVAYRHSTVDEVERKILALTEDLSKGVLESLALLALRERTPGVLKLCLDKGGFPFRSRFIEESNKVDPVEYPETAEVLEQSEFRKIWPYTPPPKKPPRPHPATVFDIGGKYPVLW